MLRHHVEIAALCVSIVSYALMTLVAIGAIIFSLLGV